MAVIVKYDVEGVDQPCLGSGKGHAHTSQALARVWANPSWGSGNGQAKPVWGLFRVLQSLFGVS